MHSSNLLSQETERRTILTFPEPMCTLVNILTIGRFHNYHISFTNGNQTKPMRVSQNID